MINYCRRLDALINLFGGITLHPVNIMGRMRDGHEEREGNKKMGSERKLKSD